MTQALLKKGQDEQFPSRILKFPSTRNANEVSRPRFGHGGENFSEDWDDFVEFVECFPNMVIPKDGLTLSQKGKYIEKIRYSINAKTAFSAAKFLLLSVPTTGTTYGYDVESCLKTMYSIIKSLENIEYQDSLEQMIRRMVALRISFLVEDIKKNILTYLYKMEVSEDIICAFMLRKTSILSVYGAKTVGIALFYVVLIGILVAISAFPLSVFEAVFLGFFAMLHIIARCVPGGCKTCSCDCPMHAIV